MGLTGPTVCCCCCRCGAGLLLRLRLRLRLLLRSFCKHPCTHPVRALTMKQTGGIIILSVYSSFLTLCRRPLLTTVVAEATSNTVAAPELLATSASAPAGAHIAGVVVVHHNCTACCQSQMHEYLYWLTYYVCLRSQLLPTLSFLLCFSFFSFLCLCFSFLWL